MVTHNGGASKKRKTFSHTRFDTQSIKEKKCYDFL
jgi:hypothetical protein